MSSPGVIVLGMHRSGTSAVARTISLLGASLGRRNDVSGWDKSNPRGYWESRSLLVYNDGLLARLGASWDRPPSTSIDLPSLVGDAERERAQRAFHQVYALRRGWTWKDPRNCLLLDYWIEALKLRPLVLYTYRHPLEVALSLQRRDGMPLEYGLGLWERYNQRALQNAKGCPALVLAYSELVTTPQESVRTIAGWLAGHEVCTPSARDIKRATRNIEPGLNHWSGPAGSDLPDGCAAIFGALERGRGAHEALTLDVPAPRPQLQRLFDESGTLTRPWIAS